jgi:hypothetical protein
MPRPKTRLDELITKAEASVARLEKIRELHSPEPIPEGMVLMGHKEGETSCQGCATGDPFLDQTWPCETRMIADGED